MIYLPSKSRQLRMAISLRTLVAGIRIVGVNQSPRQTQVRHPRKRPVISSANAPLSYLLAVELELVGIRIGLATKIVHVIILVSIGEWVRSVS